MNFVYSLEQRCFVAHVDSLDERAEMLLCHVAMRGVTGEALFIYLHFLFHLACCSSKWLNNKLRNNL